MRLLPLLVFLLAAGPAWAQAPPTQPTRIPSLEEACRGDEASMSLVILDWAAHSTPVAPAKRAAFSPMERAAYRLVEAHYQPYRDPQMASSWTGRFPYALVQQSLRVDVASDAAFERWEDEDYALDLNWNDPPLLRSVRFQPFRPALRASPATPLYARPSVRQALVDFLLPLRAVPSDEIRRRVDCLAPYVGLLDWARTSNDVHAPPGVSLLLNASRTRAIAAYDWGTKGGVWVLYRRARPAGEWAEVRPIGAWSYEK